MDTERGWRAVSQVSPQQLPQTPPKKTRLAGASLVVIFPDGTERQEFDGTTPSPPQGGVTLTFKKKNSQFLLRNQLPNPCNPQGGGNSLWPLNQKKCPKFSLFKKKHQIFKFKNSSSKTTVGNSGTTHSGSGAKTSRPPGGGGRSDKPFLFTLV